MSDPLRKERFRIVRPRESEEIKESDFKFTGSQKELFPKAKSGLLIFVYFPEVSEDEFRKTLEFTQPCLALELRTTPRFDIGRLNRQQAFREFELLNCSYVDLTSSLESDDPLMIISEAQSFLIKTKPSLLRPIMFFLNRSDDNRHLIDRLLSSIHKFYSGKPEVYEIPRCS